MNSRYILSDVVDFCVRNKKKKAFKDFTYEQIAEHIIQKTNENNLYIVADEEGICGVCTISVGNFTLYIHQLICCRRGFNTLVQEVRKRFPGKLLTATRNNKQVTFIQEKLWAMLHHQSEVKHGKFSEPSPSMRQMRLKL